MIQLTFILYAVTLRNYNLGTSSEYSDDLVRIVNIGAFGLGGASCFDVTLRTLKI